MNIILGFGKTEEDFESQEIGFVQEFIKNKRDTHGGKYSFYVTDDIVIELSKAIGDRKKHYDELNKEYKDSSQYPERYSTFYFTVLDDAGNVVVIFTFHHINRRHPMSPDGWGLMISKRICHININD